MNHVVIIDTFNLDALNEKDFELPPGRAADLSRPINRQQCSKAEVVHLEGGTWFLRWKERHPEMVSRLEYVMGKDDAEAERLYFERTRLDYDAPDIAEREAEYGELQRVLPYKDYELPLTRQEAFILVAACWLPEEFWPELAKHDNK